MTAKCSSLHQGEPRLRDRANTAADIQDTHPRFDHLIRPTKVRLETAMVQDHICSWHVGALTGPIRHLNTRERD